MSATSSAGGAPGAAATQAAHSHAEGRRREALRHFRGQRRRRPAAPFRPGKRRVRCICPGATHRRPRAAAGWAPFNRRAGRARPTAFTASGTSTAMKRRMVKPAARGVVSRGGRLAARGLRLAARASGPSLESMRARRIMSMAAVAESTTSSRDAGYRGTGHRTRTASPGRPRRSPPTAASSLRRSAMPVTPRRHPQRPGPPHASAIATANLFGHRPCAAIISCGTPSRIDLGAGCCRPDRALDVVELPARRGASTRPPVHDSANARRRPLGAQPSRPRPAPAPVRRAATRRRQTPGATSSTARLEHGGRPHLVQVARGELQLDLAARRQDT